MDNFEKYLKENRNQFDDLKADRAKLWANIETKLDNDSTVPVSDVKIVQLKYYKYIKIAAVIVVTLGLFGFLNLRGFSNEELQNTIANQELMDIDMHYKGLVAYQVKLVNNSKQLSQEEKKEFLSFMDELDDEYKTLKKELLKNVDSERVLEAIVLNYKKRIEIIENLLKLVNDSKKINDEHEYVL